LKQDMFENEMKLNATNLQKSNYSELISQLESEVDQSMSKYQ